MTAARSQPAPVAAKRELNARPVTNYFRVGDLHIVGFDDRDPRDTARARARADELAAKGFGVACLYRRPEVPGPWARYMLIGESPPAPVVVPSAVAPRAPDVARPLVAGDIAELALEAPGGAS